jgi:hypothetical protein
MVCSKMSIRSLAGLSHTLFTDLPIVDWSHISGKRTRRGTRAVGIPCGAVAHRPSRQWRFRSMTHWITFPLGLERVQLLKSVTRSCSISDGHVALLLPCVAVHDRRP